ncbi:MULTISPECIES: hypothetical protein [unclassified Streptomyces]|uniref:Helix-turn-helix transcriptional regulator n=1 Tax=Streptomyces sp. NBC_00060 TaxID=2975636 RepID=A0AAU2HAH2_9ACTN
MERLGRGVVYSASAVRSTSSSVEAESNGSLPVVRPSSLLSALTGLFETAWRSAYPMYLSGQVPRALRPVQRRILELLGTGVSDDNIADLLGISRRTLSRNLEQLHQLAGSVSRFQLALHAARHDWIRRTALHDAPWPGRDLTSSAGGRAAPAHASKASSPAVEK